MTVANATVKCGASAVSRKAPGWQAMVGRDHSLLAVARARRGVHNAKSFRAKPLYLLDSDLFDFDYDYEQEHEKN